MCPVNRGLETSRPTRFLKIILLQRLDIHHSLMRLGVVYKECKQNT